MKPELDDSGVRRLWAAVLWQAIKDADYSEGREMNENDIIRMAQECQLIGMRPHLDGIYEEALERFAALVAAAEREACAQACENAYMGDEAIHDWPTPEMCAAAIRARGAP